jgi:glycosyltransferase involved in cell wall biosynthesis
VSPYLSLVVPAYNASRFIEDSVRSIIEVLDRLDRPFEVIVVCDGSSDGTAACARGIRDDRLVVLSYPLNQGKGHAVWHGLEHASGRLVGWLDADLDVHPSMILDAARVFEVEAIDAVVGSKRHSDSSVSYPAIRRVYSAAFQLLVRLLFRVNVRDTQVGAKLFRREMLDTVAPLLLVKRWAFDLEVLAVGAEFGFDRIHEAPIALEYRFTGSSINWYAVRLMIQDTLAIAYRIHIRHHYVRRFAALQRHRMEVMAVGGEAPDPATQVAATPDLSAAG